jgi:anti-anti-sigma regulatory factor
METQEPTVQVEHVGLVRVLAFTGDLDVIAARYVLAEALRAMRGLADLGQDRVALDLSGLTYLDCAGARALTLVARSAPNGCRVDVRAVSPVAARVLRLLDVSLERAATVAIPASSQPSRDWARDLLHRSAATRASMRRIHDQVAGTLAAVASTEDRVAFTFSRMAGERPHRASRLTDLARQAQRGAASGRLWVDALAVHAEESPHGARSGSG